MPYKDRSNKGTVMLEKDTIQELRDLGRKGETYDMIIKGLIKLKKS